MIRLEKAGFEIRPRDCTHRTCHCSTALACPSIATLPAPPGPGRDVLFNLKHWHWHTNKLPVPALACMPVPPAPCAPKSSSCHRADSCQCFNFNLNLNLKLKPEWPVSSPPRSQPPHRGSVVTSSTTVTERPDGCRSGACPYVQGRRSSNQDLRSTPA